MAMLDNCSIHNSKKILKLKRLAWLQILLLKFMIELMRMKKSLWCLCFLPFILMAQTPKKYPALLWKISGNGIKKPSYLYGTMHVSNRVAYYLSEQFFEALESSEVVGLETNPGEWLDNMEKTGELAQAGGAANNNISGSFYRSAFGFSAPDKKVLQGLLSYDPDIIDGLLYRQNRSQQNFEESTYIDLFIFQTASKLNKQLISLEDFTQSEIKARLAALPDDENGDDEDSYGQVYGNSQKIEDAYRDGNLDMLDSLSKLGSSKNTQRYLINDRNLFFVNTMDSVMKSKSLFAGVGAAHLPGVEGVIELLRKRGYTVEPMMPKVTKKSHALRDEMDQKRKPVQFVKHTSSDSLFTVQLPGKLFPILQFGNISYLICPDMVNGNFFTVVRYKHQAPLFHSSAAQLKATVDSLLFENIPGKILSKTEFTTATGIAALDVLSKTRNGDEQRYHLYFTDLEMLLFKLGGRGNYASGAEAKQFFSSIQIQAPVDKQVLFSPPTGGFKVKIPANYRYHNNDNSNAIGRVEELMAYQAKSNTWMGMKQVVYNDFNYLEEDTFELIQLAKEALSQLSYTLAQNYQLGEEQALPCIRFSGTNAAQKQMAGKIFIKGVHYYLIYTVSASAPDFKSPFFESFVLTDFKYLNPMKEITDPDYFFKVQDEVTDDAQSRFNDQYAKAYKASRTKKDSVTDKGEYTNGNKYYYSPSSNEYVNVYYEQYNQYDYRSKKHFLDQVKKTLKNNGSLLLSAEQMDEKGALITYSCLLKDTATRRAIKVKIFSENGQLWEIRAPLDTLQGLKGWTKSFMESFTPLDTNKGKNLFVSKFSQLVNDLCSTDTLLRNRANAAHNNVLDLQEADLQEYLKLINSPRFSLISDESRAQFFVNSASLHNNAVVEPFKKWYAHYTDSFYLQLSILKGLAYTRTQASFTAFRDLLSGEVPLVGNSDLVEDVFNVLHDSLPLCKSFFPSMLDLCKYDEYREAVYTLLADLVHQQVIPATIYQPRLEAILADANLALKRSKAPDAQENKSGQSDSYNEFSHLDKANREQAEKLKSYLEGYTRNMNLASTAGKNNDFYFRSTLVNYAWLLSPFYATNEKAKLFIKKVAKQADDEDLMLMSIDMMKYKNVLADTLFTYFAKKETTRVYFYSELEKEHLAGLFPKTYLDQSRFIESLVKCQIELGDLYRGSKDRSEADSLVAVTVLEVSNIKQQGRLYIYRYGEAKPDEVAWCLVFVSGKGGPDKAAVVSRMELVDPGFYVDPRKKQNDNLNEARDYFRLLYRNRHASREESYAP